MVKDMKRIILVMNIAAIITACNKEATVTEPEQESLLSFETVSEQMKTVLDNQHKVLWESGDCISVFDGTENYMYSASSSGENITFKGNIPSVSGEKTYYAIYPYSEAWTCAEGVISAEIPAVQYARKGTFPDKASVTVASTQSNVLNFKNVCGLLQMTISTDDIVKIEVTADEGQYFAGEVDINVSAEPGVVVRNGASSLTILPEEGKTSIEAGIYYFPVIPQTFTNLMLKFTNSEGKVSVKCADYSNTIERSSGLKMGTVDASLAWSSEIKGIFNADDFIAFAKAVNADSEYKALSAWASDDGVVYIRKNLDMTGKSQVIWTYNGILDGCGKTISNYDLSVSATNSAMVAVLNGTIRNLNLDASCSFTQKTSKADFSAGSLAGTVNATGRIENCRSKASVIVNSTGGGTQVRVGGIAGRIYPGVELSDCEFGGKISVTAPSGADLVCGGITAYVPNDIASVKLTGCTNSANISLTELQSGKMVRLGGIVGICRAPSSKISNCVNDGSLEVTVTASNSCLGGICGFLDIWDKYSSLDVLTLSECCNNGSLTLNSGATDGNARLLGGIVGKQSRYTMVENCENTGNVNNNSVQVSYTGGVVGNTMAMVSGCTNKGVVSVSDRYTTGMAHLGGIAGYSDGADASYAEIRNSSNYGEVRFLGSTSGSAGVGGIVGRVVRADISGCTNTGVVSSTKTGAVAIVGWFYNPTAGTIITPSLSGCQVRGTIDTGTPVVLTAGNFSKYIYGDKPSSGVTVTLSDNVFE